MSQGECRPAFTVVARRFLVASGLPGSGAEHHISKSGGAAGNGTTGVATSSQDEQVTFLPDGTLAKRTKLGVVVKDAVRRWYLEAEKEAYRGDVVSA
mgnify:CR=1 FL=1